MSRLESELAALRKKENDQNIKGESLKKVCIRAIIRVEYLIKNGNKKAKKKREQVSQYKKDFKVTLNEIKAKTDERNKLIKIKSKPTDDFNKAYSEKVKFEKLINIEKQKYIKLSGRELIKAKARVRKHESVIKKCEKKMKSANAAAVKVKKKWSPKITELRNRSRVLDKQLERLEIRVKATEFALKRLYKGKNELYGCLKSLIDIKKRYIVKSLLSRKGNLNSQDYAIKRKKSKLKETEMTQKDFWRNFSKLVKKVISIIAKQDIKQTFHVKAIKEVLTTILKTNPLMRNTHPNRPPPRRPAPERPSGNPARFRK